MRERLQALSLTLEIDGVLVDDHELWVEEELGAVAEVHDLLSESKVLPLILLQVQIVLLLPLHHDHRMLRPWLLVVAVLGELFLLELVQFVLDGEICGEETQLGPRILIERPEEVLVALEWVQLGQIGRLFGSHEGEVVFGVGVLDLEPAKVVVVHLQRRVERHQILQRPLTSCLGQAPEALNVHTRIVVILDGKDLAVGLGELLDGLLAGEDFRKILQDLIVHAAALEEEGQRVGL
mmetsp:Transcript_23040/g.22423  ORF Transcript_23040/g.22423 Transcript_23040/m.22423 type:complete len:237 (+) Transcript_23040:3179-3889(+)